MQQTLHLNMQFIFLHILIKLSCLYTTTTICKSTWKWLASLKVMWLLAHLPESVSLCSKLLAFGNSLLYLYIDHTLDALHCIGLMSWIWTRRWIPITLSIFFVFPHFFPSVVYTWAYFSFCNETLTFDPPTFSKQDWVGLFRLLTQLPCLPWCWYAAGPPFCRGKWELLGEGECLCHFIFSKDKPGNLGRIMWILALYSLDCYCACTWCASNRKDVKISYFMEPFWGRDKCYWMPI